MSAPIRSIRPIRAGLAAAVFALALASATEAPARGLSSGLDAGAAAAVAACRAHSDAFGPMQLLSAVGDGMGDTLVWLSDRDGDYWACNADAEGAVFAYVAAGPDLLDGEGVWMIEAVGLGTVDPLERAAAVCAMAVGEGGDLVAVVDDGFGDALAWVESGSDLFMCNASPSGSIFVLEQVDLPLNGRDEAAAGGDFPWPV